MAYETKKAVSYPYSDELMRWDEGDKRYYLTEQALIESGTDVCAMLAANDAVNADFIINRVLKHTTTQIYNYIHKQSTNNTRQDAWIEKVPSLRAIIYDALLLQAEHLLSVGDPTRTLERDKREMGVDVNAIEKLNTTVAELGVPVTYSGW
jgi:hypothetical protein